METENNVGIWIDHFNAHLIDVNAEINNCSIASKFRCSEEEELLNISGGHMQNKKRQIQEAYYQKIANEILKYDEVLFFGPASAKIELKNFLLKKAYLKKVKTDSESEGRLTVNKINAFIKKHFGN